MRDEYLSTSPPFVRSKILAHTMSISPPPPPPPMTRTQMTAREDRVIMVSSQQRRELAFPISTQHQLGDLDSEHKIFTNLISLLRGAV